MVPERREGIFFSFGGERFVQWEYVILCFIMR
jgi:hypothetical protein